MEQEKAESVIEDFFKKRFPNKDIKTEKKSGYFDKWVKKFKSGDPESFMDKESLKVWKGMDKSDRIKMEITNEMLKGEGSKVLVSGTITDEEINYYGWGDIKKPLKFVAVKGFIDDWCIYIESMNEYQSYDEVRDVGNKISKDSAKILVDCNGEVLNRYRL